MLRLVNTAQNTSDDRSTATIDIQRLFNSDGVQLLEDTSLISVRGNDIPIQWRSAGVSELSKIGDFNPYAQGEMSLDELKDEISLRPCNIRTFTVQLGTANGLANNSTSHHGKLLRLLLVCNLMLMF